MYIRITYLVLAALVMMACERPANPAADSQFTDELRLATTPVKNQGASSVCWMYAMLSTIETDRLSQGDSVNLSVAFPLRRYIEEGAAEAMLGGRRHAITMRGTACMALSLLDTYGAAPYDSYPAEGVNYDALARGVNAMARRSQSLSHLRRQVGDMLDSRMGALPQRVYMLHAQYSFGEFARSVYAQDYQALTSFTHHPFGRGVVLELPDNHRRDSFLNVPLDTLMHAIDRALDQGYAVCWEGDISEPGFSFSRGVATLPHSLRYDQQLRQRWFERRQTTDDHCMCIIGRAHDRQGRPYYIAKNSWGTDNPFGGMMYISRDYIRMKTIAIVINNETCHIRL